MLLISLLLLAMAAPQNDVPRSRDLVTVSGCVSGSHLKLARGNSDSVAATLHVSEYVLEGSKELLRTLRKDHDGHYEEITGALKLPAGQNPNDVQVKQKQLGPKTRITLGTRETNGEELPVPVRIVVSSYRHLANRCSER